MCGWRSLVLVRPAHCGFDMIVHVLNTTARKEGSMPGKVFLENLPEHSRPKPRKRVARLIALLVTAAPLIVGFVQTGPGKVGY